MGQACCTDNTLRDTASLNYQEVSSPSKGPIERVKSPVSSGGNGEPMHLDNSEEYSIRPPVVYQPDEQGVPKEPKINPTMAASPVKISGKVFKSGIKEISASNFNYREFVMSTAIDAPTATNSRLMAGPSGHDEIFDPPSWMEASLLEKSGVLANPSSTMRDVGVGPEPSKDVQLRNLMANSDLYTSIFGKFRFALTEYPGKDNPVHSLKDPQGAWCYYGQTGPNPKNPKELLFEGKGFLLQDNTFHSGYFRNGRREGPGQLILLGPAGACYRGFWSHDEMEGNGMLITQSGYQYIGEWLHSQQDGYGEESWPDGSLYKGAFVQGAREGKGEYVWGNPNSEGPKRFSGSFKNGLYNGQGVMEWYSGAKYLGQWKGGVKDGKGRYVWADGVYFEGTYNNGKKHGSGITCDPKTGTQFKGDWNNGILIR